MRIGILLLIILIIGCIRKNETSITDSSIEDSDSFDFDFPKILDDNIEIATKIHVINQIEAINRIYVQSSNLETLNKDSFKTEFQYFHDSIEYSRSINDVIILVDTSQAITFDDYPLYEPIIILPTDSPKTESKNKCLKMLPTYIVNLSDTIKAINTQDSRIKMIQEALMPDSIWIPIEFWVNSWCGNSYYDNFIDPKEYLLTGIFSYSGDTIVKLRLKADLNGKIVYSNEYFGAVTKSQIKKEASKDYLEKDKNGY